jgi:hypothetical protein
MAGQVCCVTNSSIQVCKDDGKAPWICIEFDASARPHRPTHLQSDMHIPILVRSPINPKTQRQKVVTRELREQAAACDIGTGSEDVDGVGAAANLR